MSSNTTTTTTNSLSAILSDPLHVSLGLFLGLILFVFYLLLPRGVRKQYFGAYPKRHMWSARHHRQVAMGDRGVSTTHSSSAAGAVAGHGAIAGVAATNTSRGQRGTITGQQGGGAPYVGTPYAAAAPSHGQHAPANNNDEQVIHFHDTTAAAVTMTPNTTQQQDDIVISAAMQQLRDPGVLIIAHGSRGKPKSVRLILTESAISWRTETRRSSNVAVPPKVGKLHQVPLAHIMYVDVGKQTTALRRVENASVPDYLCFSLLTKEGSLDLEANSPRERNALVSCFSLVLDEVHAQNWRDIYRGPSSDMPSSFDEFDAQQQQQQQH